MINTIFHFVNDPTFDYSAAVTNGDISEYTIVFNSADRSIHAKGDMFGRMKRADMADVLGDISDLLPAATDTKLGAIKIGYTSNTDSSSRKYGVKLDESNKAYVEVPWTDTITPVFDDTQLKTLIATERGRIDNFISTLSDTIDAKNRQLYADGDWVREIFGSVQDPGSVAAAYRKEIDNYLQEFDVWEYIDPEHPELGRKARIVELQNTADGLTHRMGEAETRITGAEGTLQTTTVKVSTLEHNLDGLTSTVTEISEDLDDTMEGLGTVTRKESALEQTVDSIGLRVTASEGNISTLQTQEASLQIQADKIQSRVVATENSINGCYIVTIVSNPSNAASAVNISTISAAVEAKGSLSNNQLINDEDFTTAPTESTLYKNSIPQYFTFSRYKGLTVRATEIEQTADSIALRVGTVEGDTSSLTTRTSTLEQTASSLSGRVGAVEQQANTTDTALADLTLEVTGTNGVKNSLSSLSSSVSTYENDNDTNLGNLIKMAASVLELKSSQNAQGYLSSTADVASAITNGSFTGYSGLASKVSEIDGAYVSQASLTTQLQALDVSGQIATATSGLASESYVRTTAASEADDAETAAKGYADTKKAEAIASASSTMYAAVDEVCAGIGVTVTKNADGSYQSVSQISADNIYLNGNTWAQYIGVGTIVADTLTAGTATINAATINSANITGTLNGVNGVFSGSLSAATGSFSGEVTASEFIAGDSVSGFSINIVPSAFQFNWKGTPLAWFSLCDWDSTNNTFATPAANPQGFYLYMRNPIDGHMITIDFANLTFKDLNANSNPVYTYPLYSITRLNGNVAYDPVISQDRDVYYTDVNGTKTWYSNSQGTTALSSVSGYRKASINYGTGPNTGSPMASPHVLKKRSAQVAYDLVKADIYIGQTLSGGQVVDDTSKIVVVVTDTDGHYKICTPISGNPKSVSGSVDVYYQGYLSNNYPGGHRDVATSSTTISAYVVEEAGSSNYSTTSVTYFDNNNSTTVMLATTYPAA